MPWTYVIGMHDVRVELYIDRQNAEENKSIFDRLHQHREAIDRAFGEPLDWQRLDDKQACRIKRETTVGGYRSPEEEWPRLIGWMVDAMVRLEAAWAPTFKVAGGDAGPGGRSGVMLSQEGRRPT